MSDFTWKGETVIVRCRNVMDGLYKAEGTIVSTTAGTVTVRHDVSPVQPQKVLRTYSRVTGSWICGECGTRPSRCSYITEGQLRALSLRS